MCDIMKGRSSAISTGTVKATLVLFFMLLLSLQNSAFSADLQGSKDHQLLKRFGGSSIVGYSVQSFNAYSLQTSTFKKYNTDTGRREFVSPPLVVEGRYTQIWYEAAGETSSLELFRNYLNELKAKGFSILYDSKKDPAATNWSGYLAPYNERKIKTSRSRYLFSAADYSGLCVASARLKKPDGNVYVQLTAVEWNRNDAVYKAEKGAYIAVDIIEEQAMKKNMVVVKADAMKKAIASSGRIALYGIFFDSGKAVIKPASKPVIAEIAKLLKQDPSLVLHVVGHTDNAGGYTFNMGLSRKRALAVVSALARQHGIASSRLIANGVGYLAPVATNTSAAGRAKNRRVELVPR
ncbi:MAG: OmpA family protein [Chlorobium sp.]|nr:OmpA family protein [Chlorobium sp.]MCW8820032.1 OmpA family protein [Ignavibacteriaceae bacterium]